ncbi:MAG: hypothetical protein KDK54_19075 [Leptospiraceae bacterium]|nr:hypothetical protein [Leptospiraceae bacterium]
MKFVFWEFVKKIIAFFQKLNESLSSATPHSSTMVSAFSPTMMKLFYFTTGFMFGVILMSEMISTGATATSTSS